ncbi:CUB and zona pellucida-like domain-containing protein 1 [Fundulus diaphanus]
MEIRVKAHADYSVINNIIFSGPSAVTKHRDVNNDFVLRWTPVGDDLGDHYSICFVVESEAGSSIYQSEMRCVLVVVRKAQIEATVTCTETTMKVEVEKDSFFGLQEDHLRLSDPSNTICSLDRLSNNTHIVAIIPLNGCGTEIEEDDDYLIFKNEITTVEDNLNELITRKHLVEARFYCQYPKRGNVTLSFSAHRKNVTVWEKGFGKFTYQFEFYQDDQFGAIYDPNFYPLEFDIGNRIYMQINASSSINNTKMFVESCRAAPYDNPNFQPSYSIIENGCNVDQTVQTHPTSNNRRFRFSMDAFKFIGLHDQVYISCTVMMCEAGNPNTRCSQGCMNSTSSNVRRKREAMVQSGMHFVSQGPLRLKREADIRGGSAFNLNLNLVFVAGCLLVAIGMVCGVLIYKTKASRIRYQPLSSYEN